MDPQQLARLRSTIERDIEHGRYFGASIMIARHGEVALECAIGATGADGSTALTSDSVFRILSATKSLTNAVVLQCIDHGLLAFNTRVIDVIPEFVGTDRFRADRKDRVTVAHLLSHTAGLPTTPEPVPYDRIGDPAAVIPAICDMDIVSEPGERLVYSPAVNHALLGEIARRVTGAERFRDALQARLLDPLGMRLTALGVPAGREVVPISAPFDDEAWLTRDDLEALNGSISGDAEIPWVGATSSVGDLFTFAEMLRAGGTHGGERILSPAVIDQATVNVTGEQPNDLFRRVAERMKWEVGPGFLGLGFPLSGDSLAPSMFGTMTSPRTFGGFGAGSSLWWVDPARDLTFVCLTAGLLPEDENILRFQRLSDMAVAAVTE